MKMPEKPSAAFMYGFTLLYFLVGLAGLWNHSLWLDEAQHWLLARESHSFSELLANIRNEGHPLLWSGLLFGITRLTANPLAMQLLHLLTGTAAVWVFLAKAPFSKMVKVLFIFGYFMVFEYSAISRNYMLGILLLFLAFSLYPKRNHQYIRLSVFLAAAANVHLMFAVVAFGFYLTLLREQWEEQTFWRKDRMAGNVLFLLGCALLALQLGTTNSQWLFETFPKMAWYEKGSKGFMSLFKGVAMLPDFRTIHFWNTNLVVALSKPLALVLGLLAYGLPLLLFRHKKTLYFVYLSLIGTQFFFLVTQRSGARFDGLPYFILIFALWMERCSAETKPPLWPKQPRWLRGLIVYGMLAIHLLSGVAAYGLALRYPFTGAKEAAAFLNSDKLAGKTVLSYSCDGTALCPYLDRPVWFLSEQSFQTYCHWGIAYQTTHNKTAVTDALTHYMQNHDEALFASGVPFFGNSPGQIPMVENGFKIRLLKKCEGNIQQNSDYYIYEVTPSKTEKP